MRKVWGTGLAAAVTRNQRPLLVDGKAVEVSFGLDANLDVQGLLSAIVGQRTRYRLLELFDFFFFFVLF